MSEENESEEELNAKIMGVVEDVLEVKKYEDRDSGIFKNTWKERALIT